MPFPFQIYNHSNDGRTAAIRAEMAVVRALALACTGDDENIPGRTLAQYIADADVAVARPESFFRHVDIIWHGAALVVPRYVHDRRFRVTYSGNVRPGGGVSFEAYCIVDPAWFATLLPLHQTPIQVDYVAGMTRDLLVVT